MPPRRPPPRSRPDGAARAAGRATGLGGRPVANDPAAGLEAAARGRSRMEARVARLEPCAERDTHAIAEVINRLWECQWIERAGAPLLPEPGPADSWQFQAPHFLGMPCRPHARLRLKSRSSPPCEPSRQPNGKRCIQ